MTSKTEKEIKNKHEITDKEKLAWIFQSLIKYGKRIPNLNNELMIEFNQIFIEPYFSTNEDFIQDFEILFKTIKSNKDFLRKNNMTNYNPSFYIDEDCEFSKDRVIFFSDFTDDFIKLYLTNELGVKKAKEIGHNKIIIKIELLEDKKEQGRIKVYINGNYEIDPMDFSRNKNWGKMYELAKKQEVPFEKSFYDYFNYQQTNPLYTNGFKTTQILKEQDGYIVPNIEIKLITANKITRQLNSA